MVVARVEADAVAGLEQRDGVLRVVDQPLEGGAAHQRAPQRPGGAVPGDRRAGVQELAGLETEQVAGGRDVDQVGGDAEHRLDRLPVGVAAARVGGDRDQVVLGAGHRRAPRHALDLDRLRGEGVGEQVGADGDDAVGRDHRRTSGELDRAAGRRRVGQVDLGAGLDQRPDLPVAVLRVERGADDATTTGRSTSASAGASSAAGIGFGAVAEHDVEQHHPGGRVGRCLPEVVEPQRRVDHRVGAALGVGVVAEVDERVTARRLRR